MAEEIFNAEYECPGCNKVFNFTNIHKLQHMAVCKKPVDVKEPEEESLRPPSSSNQKIFKCAVCLKQMCLTNVEILKHKKNCKIKEERK